MRIESIDVRQITTGELKDGRTIASAEIIVIFPDFHGTCEKVKITTKVFFDIDPNEGIGDIEQKALDAAATHFHLLASTDAADLSALMTRARVERGAASSPFDPSTIKF